MGIESDKQQKRPVKGQMIGKACGEGNESKLECRLIISQVQLASLYTPLFLLGSGWKSEGNLEFEPDVTLQL